MRTLLIALFYGLVFTSITCSNKSESHQSLSPVDDSVVIKKAIPSLTASICLESLLSAIVKSNARHYKQGQSFYGLHIDNKKQYWYMEIYLDRWNDAKDTTYSAMLKVKNAVFLCSGDIQGNALFQKTTLNNQMIKLTVNIKSKVEPMLVEPSLQGTLRICPGLPLYVEVYTPEPIAGYKMNIKKP